MGATFAVPPSTPSPTSALSTAFEKSPEQPVRTIYRLIQVLNGMGILPPRSVNG